MVTGDGSPPEAAHSVGDYERGFEVEHRIRGFASACGFVTATWGLRCPRCGDPLVEAELPRRGRIAAVTVQTVPSEEFLKEAPYAYALVDLDGGARVSGWIRGISPTAPLAIGDPVELVDGERPGVQFRRTGSGRE